MEDEGYSNEVVQELVNLGVGTFSECVAASKEVINYKDINTVSEKVKEMKKVSKKKDLTENAFSALAIEQGTHYVSRIKYILSEYDKWVEERANADSSNNAAAAADDDDSKMDIYELVTGPYPNKKNGIASFMSDYDKFILNIDSLDYFIDDEEACSMKKCAFIQRGFRDVNAIRENPQIRKEIYYGQSNEKSIVLMQMLDILHNTLFHTYEMGLRVKKTQSAQLESEYKIKDDPGDPKKYNKNSDEKNATNDDENDDDDYEMHDSDDEAYFSRKVDGLKNVINQRSEGFVNVRPDFNVAVVEKELKRRKSEENNNDNDNDNDDRKRRENEVITKQETSVQDIKNVMNANNKFVTNVEDTNVDLDALTSYSFGIRFYYHSYYKNKHVESEAPDGYQLVDRGNKGYKMSFWYICAKYASLKEELLNNKLYNLKLHEWENTLVKAEFKLRKNSNCKATWYFEQVTGIKWNMEIDMDHVMSVLLYTNWTQLCTKFSGSFRKNWNETDADLKLKHSEFAVWGRLLRETVECWGRDLKEHEHITAFYHGISIPMVFSDLSARFCCPTSTTKTFAVALNFATKGVIITMANNKGALALWDCRIWSDYPTEDELLFIGGFLPLEVNALCEVRESKDYTVYMKSMGVWSLIVQGFVTYHLVTKEYAAIVKKLANSRLRNLKSSFAKESKSKDAPVYMMKIFENICHTKQEITLSWGFFDINFLIDHALGNLYGYKRLRKYFRNKEQSMFNLSLFYDLCPNVTIVNIRSIHIREGNDQVYTECIDLKADGVMEFIINELSNGCPINKLLIQHPVQNIQEMNEIKDKYEKIYKQNGFNITVKWDKDVRFGKYRSFCIQK